MPQVPVYNQRVSESAGPAQTLNVQARVDDSGMKVAQQMNDLAFKAQEAADKTAVNERFSQLSFYGNDLEWGENGFMKKQGSNAIKSYPEVETGWQSKVDELSDGLSSQQRDMFLGLSQKRWETMQKGFNKHLYAQRKNYDDAETKAVVQAESQAALLNYSDPELFNAHMATARGALLDYSNRSGLSAAETKLAMDSFESGIYSTLISKQNDAKNPELAELIYNENKEKFSAKDQERIEKEITIGKRRVQGTALADEISSISNRHQQNDKIREIEDIELRDFVRDQVRKNNQDMDAAQRYQEDEAIRIAVGYIEKNNGDINSIPANIIASLSPSGYTTVQNLAKKGSNRPTDLDVYEKVVRDLKSKGPQSIYAQGGLSKLQDKFSASDYKSLVKMATDASAGKTEGLSNIITDAQIVSDSIKKLGLNPKAQKHQEDITQFKLSLQEAVNAEEARLKRKLRASEKVRLASELTAEVVLERGLIFNRKKNVYQLNQETSLNPEAIRIQDIPTSTLEFIKSSKQYKDDPTDENLKDLYIKYTNRLRR